jgi:hypothetical protein
MVSSRRRTLGFGPRFAKRGRRTDLHTILPINLECGLLTAKRRVKAADGERIL